MTWEQNLTEQGAAAVDEFGFGPLHEEAHTGKKFPQRRRLK